MQSSLTATVSLQFDYAFVNNPGAVGRRFVRNVVMKFTMVSFQS
jgi:hypothetical protein